jgi:UDP-N-acetylglucosamine transferase subunit ALG13
MIFVTVGTDLPFDRMMKVIDKWARENSCHEVFAQIGEDGWEPEYIQFAHFLRPAEFVEYFKSASLIISHAGMGTILSAQHYGKPILVMPKKASLGEHRNEHQTATARQMREIGGVNVAFDEDELLAWLDRLHELVAPRRIGESASSALVKGLSDFIHQRVS